MTLPLKNLIGATFSDLYPNRPVWALVSTGTTSSLNSPVYSTYGEQSNYAPLNVEFPGTAKSRARNFQDEMANSAYTFSGTTAALTLTGVVSFNAGMLGICQTGTQTGCLANFEAYDNGNYGWYSSGNSSAFQLATDSGTIVGESNWRQCYDLLLTSTGKIYKDEIGGVSTTATGGNRPFIDLENSAIPNFVKYGTNSWGRGQIAHNRNTGRLLVAQPIGGTSGTKITFRLHLFDLQNKISRNTTIAQLKQWMTDATVAGANRYRYVDVDLASPQCYYGGTAITHDCADTQFALCDNDEIWAFKSSDNASIGQNTYGNVLFSINLTNGTWLTGTYAATARVNYSGTGNAGLQFNAYYGARHMNSDDNSVIAFYQQAYYYVCGYSLAMVSTKSAGAQDYNYGSNNTGAMFSIAPAGGPNFVMSSASTANSDGIGPVIGFLNNETLAATAVTPSFVGYMWPGYNRSTCYGTADIVCKVQPTTEWK
ncbi:hypothetical protein [Massilia sp. TN1-12]|uniref:hypothetical protein n=1 Tax=Massilia paldalensis TaxID=3377675 RepID=UPI00384CEA38